MGGHHLSKLSQLKQDAYQAGKARDWDLAISVYEQILEIEKKNPTLVNELGDICLKSGESSRAVKYFLNAASLYRKNGLVNNAVAIYKKILRYDSDNLNAHWYLAESRAGQGLKAEGQAHVMVFLTGSGDVAGDLKEIFLKRCVSLLELYPDNEEILDKLVQIFRMWEKPLEAARAGILQCCLSHGKEEAESAAGVETIVAREPAVKNYPEYSRWSQLVDPQGTGPSGAYDDFGSVNLGDTGPAPTAPGARQDVLDDVAAPRDESTSFGEVALDGAASTVQAPPSGETSSRGLDVPDPADESTRNETSFSDLNAEIDSPEKNSDETMPDADPLALDKDEEGCLSIDSQGIGDLGEILSAAMGTDKEEANPATDPDQAPGSEEGKVNLLDQLLAEDDGDLLGRETNQLETITAEIGAQVGGDEDTPDRKYEMGLVYLEMGMLDQAIDCFQGVSADPKYAGRAYEMWSITLERSHRMEEALTVLRQGVEAEAVNQTGRLGLLYHLGKQLEQVQQTDEAGLCYDRILAQDPAYMDVAALRSKLTVTT